MRECASWVAALRSMYAARADHAVHQAGAARQHLRRQPGRGQGRACRPKSAGARRPRQRMHYRTLHTVELTCCSGAPPDAVLHIWGSPGHDFHDFLRLIDCISIHQFAVFCAKRTITKSLRWCCHTAFEIGLSKSHAQSAASEVHSAAWSGMICESEVISSDWQVDEDSTSITSCVQP